MFVSVTRLRLRSWRLLSRFLAANRRITSQVSAAGGFLQGKLLVDGGRVFWTVTAWQNEACMRTFRAAGAHGETMAKLAEWCDEASVVHWEHSGRELPDWPEAYRKLTELGRTSRVSHPSDAHRAGRIAKPNAILRLESTIKRSHPEAKAAAARA